MLGVAFGNVVTTWAPDTCELKCSLLHTLNRQPIKFLEFGVDTQCHLVVSATNESVSVWNLLTLTMVWTVSVPVRLLVADSMTPYMAVFSAEKKCKYIVFSKFIFSHIYIFCVASAMLYNEEHTECLKGVEKMYQKILMLKYNDLNQFTSVKWIISEIQCQKFKLLLVFQIFFYFVYWHSI